MNAAAPKSDRSKLSKKQFAFSAHIRDPQNNPLPEDVEDRRMSIYRDLFYNNVENFIATGFPVLRSISKDEDWHAMVREFFSQHRCKTPYFLEISAEFLMYLNEERDTSNDDSFIKELAHYEWVELALSVSEEMITQAPYADDENFINYSPVLSPLAWLLTYEYDVQHIGPEYLPVHPPSQITTLIVYRNRHDEVEFMEVNPLTAHLVQSIQLNPDMSGHDLLVEIAKAMPNLDEETVVKGGTDIFQQLSSADILLSKQ